MDHNKDIAIKAKEIAERKFIAKDFSGAKKFALKARKFYPGLEGITQMLTTLDVYASAENSVLGEPDFYGVLGVGPEASEDTIRKQYRKLALMLHPDKNKSIGAEGAFKLVSEAWSLLSDKNRKAAYDVKRSSSGVNGFYNFAKINKRTSHPNETSSTEANQGSFWTVCDKCKMQYEYFRKYLNKKLQCPNPNCRKPFLAVEVESPVVKDGFSSWKNSRGEVRKKGSDKCSDGFNTSSFKWAPFSGRGDVSFVAQAANVVQETYEKVRRVREEAQAAKKREKVMKRTSHVYREVVCSLSNKKRRVSVDANTKNNRMGFESFRFGKSSTIPPPKPSDIKSILMHKARKEILDKITVWKTSSMIGNASSLVKTKESYDKDERQKDNNDLIWPDQSGRSGKECSNSLHGFSIPVSDSDFYHFDKNRTETAFEENQVWAVYDNHDGMPRFYAMIRKVMSRDPLKIRVGWLHSNSNGGICSLNWVGSSLSKTCGEFRVGRHETLDSLNCFSHKVSWTKCTQGGICVFPRKGEVWALYKNWSLDRDEFTSDEVTQMYEIVEVLDDYDEDLGVVVIPLVKVAGFKAVFHHHLDPKQVRRIPKEENSRFSHMVPSQRILSHEGSYALKGCLELDPAALLPEFLQVIADAKEENVDESLKVAEVVNRKESAKIKKEMAGD